MHLQTARRVPVFQMLRGRNDLELSLLIRRFASRSVMVCLFPCSSKWRCAPGQQSGYSSTSASHSLSCKKAQLKADFLAVELARDIDLRNRTHGDGESGCALARAQYEADDAAVDLEIAKLLLTKDHSC